MTKNYRRGVGWFRIRDRQRTSHRVPYEQKGRWLHMYCDFLRQVDGKVVVDILDPHDPTADHRLVHMRLVVN